MAMAMTMREYLINQNVDFEEVKHPREVTASRVAQQMHVTGERVAKAVLIKGDSGFRVLLIPSTCKADLSELSHQFHERLGLATEAEMQQLFEDCTEGALPPLAEAYGVRVCYDDLLANQQDIYLEAGDHETLIHLDKADFHRLMGNAEHGQFSRHM